MKKIMSIDPSIRNCGWAVLDDKLKLIEYGLIQTKLPNWTDNCQVVWDKLYEAYSKEWPQEVIIEYPELHAGMAAVAARESGAIFKLSFVCGGIFSLLREIAVIKLVTPSKWKGQLTKELTRKRLYRIYPEIVDKNLDHNIVDAIGIGYYTLMDRE